MLIIAVIGGLYRLEGAWIGALTYALIDNYSREWVPEVGNVLGPARFNTLIGVLFLIIVLASPGGIIGIWERVKGASCEDGGREGNAGPAPARRTASRSTRSFKRGEGEMLRRTHVAMVAALRGGRHRRLRRRRRRQLERERRRRQAEAAEGGTIKIGFLSDCEGAFGSFFEPTASGANLALIKYAGAKPAGEKPTDGVDRGQDRGQGRRDRQLRLRRRHRRQGDRRDAPDDGAGGRGHPRRPALR